MLVDPEADSVPLEKDKPEPIDTLLNPPDPLPYRMEDPEVETELDRVPEEKDRPVPMVTTAGTPVVVVLYRIPVAKLAKEVPLILPTVVAD